MRHELPIGTLIRINHHTYRITAPSIGSGGGSIVYPCSQVIYNPDGTEKASIDFVLKECFPAPHKRTDGPPFIAEFIRNENGEIVPASDDEKEWSYLSIVKSMQNNEELVSKEVYKKGFRLIPVYEKADTAEISLDQGTSFHKVNNTYALMESLYYKGLSLRTLLDESDQALPVQVSIHLVEQILLALKEVHDSGYLHLDIQDNNIFIKGSLDDNSDMVSLIDFGSSRKCSADGYCEPICNRVIFSTDGFTAPEILAGNDGSLRLNPSADLYSIGYLLLYLLSGVRYSTDELKNVVGHNYLTSRRLKKLKVPKHLIDKLQSILAKSLATDVQDRYQSCAEMLEDISSFYAALTPYRSDLNQVVYDAFICYKHGKDSEVAQKLQLYLEHLKVPLGIKSQTSRIQNVFVDKGELAACADMGLVITDALKNSGWLIVICSAETKHSKWVNEEINTFLKYHDSSRILPLLTEGEPEDVYPEALLKIQKETGKEFKAADGRETTEKKVLKKVRKETVNEIAAPILGTTFATLVQRKQAYRIRRILAVAVAVLCVVSAFSAKIFLQEKKYQEAYRKQLLLYSEALTEYAQDYHAEGRTNKAIESLLQALPGGSDNELEKNRPYYPKAQYELTNLLGVYQNTNIGNHSAFSLPFTSVDAIDNNGMVQLTDFCMIGDYIFGTSDSYSDAYTVGTSLHIWNSAGEWQNTISFEGSVIELLKQELPGSTEVILYDNDSLKRINFLTGEIIWEITDINKDSDAYWSVEDLIPTTTNEANLYVVYYQEDSVHLARINPETGIVLNYYVPTGSETSIPGGYCDDCRCFIADNNNEEKALLLTLKDSSYYVNTLDLASENVSSVELPETVGSVTDLSFNTQDQKTVYISYFSLLEGADDSCQLLALDSQTGEILWNLESTSVKNRYYSRIEAFPDDSAYKQYLIWTAGNTIQVIDRSDGSIYAMEDETDDYVKSIFVEGDTFYAVLNTGMVYQFLSKDEWKKSESLAQEPKRIQKIPKKDTYYCLTKEDYLIKYDVLPANDNFHLIKDDFSIFSSLITANEKWICLGDDHRSLFPSSDLYIINKNQDTLSTIPLKDLIPDSIDQEEAEAFDLISILGIIDDELYYVLSEGYGFHFSGEEDLCMACCINLSTYEKQYVPLYKNDYANSGTFSTHTKKLAVIDQSKRSSSTPLNISIFDFNDNTFDMIRLPASIDWTYSQCRFSENGKKVLFVGRETEGQDYLYVLDLISQKMDYQIPVDDEIQYADLGIGYQKHYECTEEDTDIYQIPPNVNNFEYLALTNKTSVFIYHSGKLINTISFEQYGFQRMDLLFSDDARYLYITIGNHLLKYSISEDCIVAEDTLPILSGYDQYFFIPFATDHNAPMEELYITDGKNILNIHCDTDSFGAKAFVENAFYYDPQNERYYIKDDTDFRHPELGYFRKLSLEELLEWGR